MRTSLVAALLLAAAACGPRSSTPVGNVGGPMPTGPAPSVGMAEGGDGDFGTSFTATGLPAIANDGTSVVVAVMGEDGARGAPNLAIVERDRKDEVVHEIVVQRADDATMSDEGPPPPQAKLEEANRFLTETHGSKGWFALTPMDNLEQHVDEAAGDGGYGTNQMARAGDIVLAWDEGKVLVTSAGKTIVDRQTQGWTAPSGVVQCDGCGECSNPSFLARAWIDPSRRLILARISYTGNDMCWEPDSEDHVIAW